MAIAKTTCKCEICGNEFEVRKKCYNSKAAESYKSWAEENMSVCPDCYHARVEKEREAKAAELVARFNLPTIEGVSEKQIAYANDLRNNYLLENKREFKIAKKLANTSQEELEAFAEARGKTTDEIIKATLEYNGITKAYQLLTLSKASKIIDLLR